MNKPIHPAVAEHVMEENEKLRGLLREATHCCPDEQLRNEMKAALSQQAEPVCDTCHGQGEVYSGHDQHFHYFDFQPPEPIMETCPECGGDPVEDELPGMWDNSDLSGGETDCVEPAPAQDKREAFEALFKGKANFERNEWHPDFYAHLPARQMWEAFSAGAEWQRTLPAQTEQQPEQSGLVDALTQLLCWAEKQVCTHEETHRGGAIWEICDSCGAKWADDEGGRPAFVWPKAISNASAALSAQGESHE